MRVAVPVSALRVASTTDFAREFLLVDYEGARELTRRQVLLEESQPVNRAARIIRLDVDLLICGAISRALARLLIESGIHVVPLVTGGADEVLAAFHAGRLDEARYLLPGCTTDERRSLIGGGRKSVTARR